MKDTLCGTKALRRTRYEEIAAGRSYFGDFDPFGDFDLLLGAARLQLEIVDVPVRYQSRTYGETKISRFRHGWLLVRMAVFAYRKLKIQIYRPPRSVEAARPVRRHAALGAGHRLVGGMRDRRRELGAVVVGLVRERPEPVLARLEALDDRVTGLGGVRSRAGSARSRSSRRGRTRRSGAGGTTSRRRREALDAARAARRDGWIDCSALAHPAKLTRTASVT